MLLPTPHPCATLAGMAKQPSTADLTGKVVAITGGGRGIGAATARALAARGARVAIGDVDLPGAEQVAAQVSGLARQLDVTDAASLTSFLDAVESELGPLDVMVNNAGIMPLTPLLDEDDGTIERILAVNVTAMIRGTRDAARRMVARGHGHVVILASTAGKAGIPGAATYSASKAAMIMYAEAARLELAGSGVEISCVMPGFVQTELIDGLSDMPLMRSITPEQVAEAIADAITSPRFDVYVPRSAKALVGSTQLMPRRARDAVGRRLGIDHLFLDAAANPERKRYEDRARHQG